MIGAINDVLGPEDIAPGFRGTVGGDGVQKMRERIVKGTIKPGERIVVVAHRRHGLSLVLVLWTVEETARIICREEWSL